MTGHVSGASRQSDVETALLLLSKLGVSPEELIAGVTANRTAVPTFAEFLPHVIAAASEGTLKAYGTYWNRVIELWGARRLDEPTPLEIEPRRPDRLEDR